MHTETKEYAYVTLVTSDPYVDGALVLAAALRQLRSAYPLVALVTSAIPERSCELLAESCKVVRTEAVHLPGGSGGSGLLDARPDLANTLTKLNAWTLTAYEKCIFLDADLLILKPIDHLFDATPFAAVADAGWPDSFNSGLFVFSPSLETHAALISALQAQGSYDGCDQGLLNQYFKTWHRLPFVYNVTFSACYTFSPAAAVNKAHVAVVHFAGIPKPWCVGDGGGGVGEAGFEYAYLRDWYAKWREIRNGVANIACLQAPGREHENRHADRGANASTTVNAKNMQEFFDFRIQWPGSVDALLESRIDYIDKHRKQRRIGLAVNDGTGSEAKGKWIKE